MQLVPNLTLKNSLDYTIYLKNHIPYYDDEFDFINVETCEPFPMLVAATAIRQYRNRINSHISHNNKPKNCNNTYADTMRFYRAAGIDKGKSFATDYGNQNYLPITRLDLTVLQEESKSKLEYIQENIQRKACDMAAVLSRNSSQLKNPLIFMLREIMRNVPEHSGADSIWYCAQYWPTKDRVELSFIDEGIGIKNSLLSNYAYNNLIDTDLVALQYAIKPGISSSFTPGTQNLDRSEWANSGYGLYMISHLCAELGGNFLVASGDYALMVSKSSCGNISKNYRRCSINGTAIRINIKPSRIDYYDKAASKILLYGETEAKSNSKSIHYASQSTKDIFEDF